LDIDFVDDGYLGLGRRRVTRHLRSVLLGSLFRTTGLRGLLGRAFRHALDSFCSCFDLVELGLVSGLHSGFGSLLFLFCGFVFCLLLALFYNTRVWHILKKWNVFITRFFVLLRLDGLCFFSWLGWNSNDSDSSPCLDLTKSLASQRTQTRHRIASSYQSRAPPSP